jgi:hypothetical protein
MQPLLQPFRRARGGGGLYHAHEESAGTGEGTDRAGPGKAERGRAAAPLNVDVLVTLPDLAGETYQELQMLAPFGIDNPVPTFLSRGVEVLERRTMGNNGDHLRLKLRQQGSVWDGVAFRLGNHTKDLAPHIDLVYNMEIDRWGAKSSSG